MDGVRHYPSELTIFPLEQSVSALITLIKLKAMLSNTKKLTTVTNTNAIATNKAIVVMYISSSLYPNIKTPTDIPIGACFTYIIITVELFITFYGK